VFLLNAKFTDTNTITTINGKTGAISKADIVALGIPAQDTVYTHPSTHPASMITGLADVATSGDYNDIKNLPPDLDFHNLPQVHSTSNNDELVIYKTFDSEYRKVTKQDLLSGLGGDEYVFIVKKEEITATEGQSVFTLTEGEYIPNTGRMNVYIWGAKQPPSAFTETSPTTVTLSDGGMPAGTKVLFEWYQVTNVMDYLHANSHKTGGVDELKPADIGAAAKSEIPTKTSQLTNDSNFETTSGHRLRLPKLN